MNDQLLKTALRLMTILVAAMWLTAILVSGWIFPTALPPRDWHALIVGAATFSITTAILWMFWQERIRR